MRAQACQAPLTGRTRPKISKSAKAPHMDSGSSAIGYHQACVMILNTISKARTCHGISTCSGGSPLALGSGARSCSPFLILPRLRGDIAEHLKTKYHGFQRGCFINISPFLNLNFLSRGFDFPQNPVLPSPSPLPAIAMTRPRCAVAHALQLYCHGIGTIVHNT